MANWEKLNKEFDDLIDNLSDEEWNTWYENREEKRTVRRQKMLLEAQIQEVKNKRNGVMKYFKNFNQEITK